MNFNDGNNWDPSQLNWISNVFSFGIIYFKLSDSGPTLICVEIVRKKKGCWKEKENMNLWT